jgi:hypothetical protein
MERKARGARVGLMDSPLVTSSLIGAAIKTNHKNFPKKELEEMMKESPSGSHLVLEC